MNFILNYKVASSHDIKAIFVIRHECKGSHAGKAVQLLLPSC